MSVRVIVALALLAALLLCAASSQSSAAGEAAHTHALQQLLATARDSARRQEASAPQTRPARAERRAHLSEEEREIMTKQIMHAISEMMNSECGSDRDYQGWVDFGRRDAE